MVVVVRGLGVVAGDSRGGGVYLAGGGVLMAGAWRPLGRPGGGTGADLVWSVEAA